MNPLAAALREAAADLGQIGFTEFCESPLFCGLKLSPVMRSVALASEGRPVECDPLPYFGCAASKLPRAPPTTVAARLGARAGKTSRLLAPKALHAAWTMPLLTLGKGQIPVALIVARDLKLARETLSFVKGYAEASPVLSDALVKTPRTDDLEIRRPDGHVVRVEILAASARAAATRGRHYVFACMDEAAFFLTGAAYSVKDTDIYDGLLPRIGHNGGQIWIASTPWLAHEGLLEKLMDEHWGKQNADFLCVTGGTRAFNPTWDPEGKLERIMRANNPEQARAEIDGLPLAGSVTAFFDPATIDSAIDRELMLPRVPSPGDEVTAGADLAFQKDFAAVAVVHHVGHLRIAADLLELCPEPGKPLKPSEVCRTFGALVQKHSGVKRLVADQTYREAAREYFSEFELGIRDAPAGAAGQSEAYVRARSLFREGRVRIPNHPRLLEQLRTIQWRANVGGSISMIKPRGIGGHYDLADAFVLALWDSGGVEVEKPRPAVERAWRAHWDLEQEGLDPGERELIEQAEQETRSEWEQTMEEASYGVFRR